MARDGWFKSSFSNSGSDDCVEVRITDNTAYLRDTKNRKAGVLHVPSAAWIALANELTEHSKR